MKSLKKFALGMAVAGLSATAAAAENVKIAFIDPLSGAFAATGTNGLHQFRFAADKLVNENGGVLDGQMFEMVAFDNKTSPKESLTQLQVAIDQGIRYVVQGNGSGVAHALTDAINKHNDRNPDDRLLFLNYSAVDPALTNEKCNFWHFRFDAHADIKMDVLTDTIAENEDIEKVYIIGQDYSFGKAVASAAVRMLAEKRPDIEIVGNELHPIGSVQDFTPYARKIVSSGADAMITGNWGSDMLGIGKAAIENGFSGPIYTYYGAADGITAAFGETGVGSLKLVAEGGNNPPSKPEAQEYIRAFKDKYPDGNISQARITNVIQMLAMAIDEAGTATDVVKVGEALEGMEFTDSLWSDNPLVMRADDHQLIQEVHILGHVPVEAPFDFDNSGYGLQYENSIVAAGEDLPMSCEMDRP
ncbi:branched-chain amino acid ABC transporter substrate-binding protein [Aquicoccus sp.]|uniref:branched-chain amino acid ABC transporter substrate-binding protein n=1 Tax=Aquicoccus sp. TaxID=2055851 RepID=UPI003564BB67